MGYTTEFYGTFELNKPLDKKLAEYLQKFSETRRMKRNPTILAQMGFENTGVEGEFFVDGKGFAGQDHDESIIDYNRPPRTQPGLWCQWVPNEELTGIEWDGGEKFYHATEWIEYLIKSFFAPNGYILNGKVKAEGEDQDDNWYIHIENNVVTVEVV